ncbi:hypothetical protein WJX79_003484 [Trebouxia sp. C0005]
MSARTHVSTPNDGVVSLTMLPSLKLKDGRTIPLLVVALQDFAHVSGRGSNRTLKGSEPVGFQVSIRWWWLLLLRSKQTEEWAEHQSLLPQLSTGRRRRFIFRGPWPSLQVRDSK